MYNKGHFDYLIVLTDIEFWATNLELLQKWCKEHGSNQKGMTVEICGGHKTLMLFCLRWS